jgi:hypothetical protein
MKTFYTSVNTIPSILRNRLKTRKSVVFYLKVSIARMIFRISISQKL